MAPIRAAPKKKVATSAYMFFMKETNPVVREENKEKPLSFGDVGKEVRTPVAAPRGYASCAALTHSTGRAPLEGARGGRKEKVHHHGGGGQDGH